MSEPAHQDCGIAEKAEDKEESEGGRLSPVNTMNSQQEGDERSQLYDLDPATDSAFRMGGEEAVDGAAVKRLSAAFLQRYLPVLERCRWSVGEVVNNQTVLSDTLTQETSKFSDCTAHARLLTVMGQAKNYHNKLLTIKRDMAALHEKSAKLKRRALRLQQHKQREELQRAHQQEREMEKDHMLTARVAPPAPLT